MSHGRVSSVRSSHAADTSTRSSRLAGLRVTRHIAVDNAFTTLSTARFETLGQWVVWTAMVPTST